MQVKVQSVPMFSLIKKLDLYIVKKFLLLFAGAFCICLFILMMQFMWRYIDELIGKGLTVDILSKFFWYMGLTLIPTAMPLSILLTSLITFGNMGESLELTAMKAAGIPLKRIMLPLIVFSGFLMALSFYFQNTISPNAQKQLTRMLLTMKETSPAIEIPEGVFYNGIPDINLYVRKKDAKTGMLYDVTIYKMDQGFENAQIVVADSAQLETTADKHFLALSIFNGEQFENLRTSASRMANSMNIPYDRETFKHKFILIDFDSDFNMMDENMFANMAKAKNMVELSTGADSIKNATDSIGENSYNRHAEEHFSLGKLSAADSLKARQRAQKESFNLEKTYADMSLERRLQVMQEAARKTHKMKEDLEWEKAISAPGYFNVRKHWIEWHTKISLALACLIFFFIGAPLGAIIRKGGLGLPTVISVIVFIIYYIVNTSGMKLAKQDSIDIWLGMWISSFILAPLGLWVTYKANKDSVVFNADNYFQLIRRFFGIRRSRFFTKKQVIIYSPDYAAERETLNELSIACSQYIQDAHLPHLPNYKTLFFKPQQEDAVDEIVTKMESMLERMSNSEDAHILSRLSAYPEVSRTAHLSPFTSPKINTILGIIFPLGLLVAWRVWRYRIRLYRDMKVIQKNNQLLQERIDILLNTSQMNPIQLK